MKRMDILCVETSPDIAHVVQDVYANHVRFWCRVEMVDDGAYHDYTAWHREMLVTPASSGAAPTCLRCIGTMP